MPSACGKNSVFAYTDCKNRAQNALEFDNLRFKIKKCISLSLVKFSLLKSANFSSFRHSKRCKIMPKMHRNTFGGRAPPMFLLRNQGETTATINELRNAAVVLRK